MCAHPTASTSEDHAETGAVADAEADASWLVVACAARVLAGDVAAGLVSEDVGSSSGSSIVEDGVDVVDRLWFADRVQDVEAVMETTAEASPVVDTDAALVIGGVLVVVCVT